jgi:hypothetical protein
VKEPIATTQTAAGQAVQLTPDNLWDVFEWADSKPCHSPNPDGTGTVITGLTVWVGANRDRVKAEFGDWIVQTRGGTWQVVREADAEQMLANAEAVSA